MALPATDDFAGTGALAGTWTVAQGTVDRLSDQCRGATGANFATAYHNADVFNQNQYSKAAVPVLGSGGTDYFGVSVRHSGSGGTQNGYGVFWTNGTGGDVQKCVNGTWSTLQAAVGAAPVANDVVELRATGGATTTLELFINGISQGTVDDSSSPHTSGAAGVVFFHTGARLDNWEGGNVGAGGGGTPDAYSVSTPRFPRRMARLRG